MGRTEWGRRSTSTTPSAVCVSACSAPLTALRLSAGSGPAIHVFTLLDGRDVGHDAPLMLVDGVKAAGATIHVLGHAVGAFRKFGHGGSMVVASRVSCPASRSWWSRAARGRALRTAWRASDAQ